MAIQKILIVDDEMLMRSFLQETFKRKNYEIYVAENGSMAFDLISKEDFDLIITDIKMPIKNGMEILEYAKEKNPSCQVIMMTAHGTIENAVEAMQKGAFNYLIKPFSFETIEMLVEQAENHLSLMKENQFLKKEFLSQPFIAESPFMKDLSKQLDKIAKSQASVFISGESGTGKEVIAQAIHNLSNRSKQNFIRVNCAAIPESLLESEFFGYEKGAFTGANSKKEGRFELADKGTLLLDEITEIPLSLQPKLLRAIQEMEFERVGGTKPIKVDIRFIATSNRNMKEAISQGIFREDLFYRLHVMPIHIPPLRERKEDILALTDYFLQKFCLENHKALKTFSSEAKEKLLSYPWPGNVRELANIIERTVVLDFGSVIEKEHIHLDCIHDLNNDPQTDLSSHVGSSLLEMEKKLILATLQKEKNKQKVADILGISMKTLRTKLKTYEESYYQTTIFDESKK
jgi:two-component system response regulator AtoC